MGTPKIRKPDGPNGGDTIIFETDATIVAGSDTITGAELAASIGQTARSFGIPLPTLHPAAGQKDTMADSPNGTTLGLGDTAGAALTGSTTNGGATATASETALFAFPLPHTYTAGAAVTVRLRAKVSVARTVSATIDLEVKKQGDAALGSDICATAAQTLTTSYANYDFTVTPTGLVAGDILVGTITAAANDTGGSNNGAITITAVTVICVTAG